MKLPHPFVGPTYQNDFLDAEHQRCVNWIPKGNALLPTPGLKKVIQTGVGPHRGFQVKNDTLICVSGDEVIEVNSALDSWTSLGNINTNKGPVKMSYDGEEVGFADGAGFWVWDGATLSQISIPGVTNPSFAVFSNGYWLVNKGSTGEFYKSQNAFDAKNWDSEFATAEQNPDNLLAIAEHRADLWLAGPASTEVWYYNPDSSFPWDPNRSAFQDIGIAAKYSMAKFDNGLAWLATSEEIDRIAVRTRGYQVQRISTTPIEREWATYSYVGDAQSFSFLYPGLGHFWALIFPTANKCWCFNAETSLWHEWEKYDPPNYGRPLAQTYVKFQGKHLVGDHTSGWIYEISPDYWDDAGTAIRRLRMGPDVFENRQKIQYTRMEIEMRAGVGRGGGASPADPIMYLNYSDTRGKTWGNPRELNIGKAGAYKKRLIARRLGSSRSRIFQIRTSEAVPLVITNATVSAELKAT